MLETETRAVHKPVLREEVLRELVLPGTSVLADCTVGDGGHAEAMLEALGAGGFLIGLDRDPKAVQRAGERLKRHAGRFFLVHENFNRLDRVLDDKGFSGVDGILMDLGISSVQLDDPVRGFSFQKDGPLDMRMDQGRGLTASELVNTLPERDLLKILFQYGEERWSRRIVRAILRVRQQQPIRTTLELARIIREAVPPAYRHRRIHPATKTFQALRVAVNQELDGLEDALVSAAGALNPGGRLGVIAFHSLEDRIVKQTFRRLAPRKDGSYTRVTKKPIIPGEDEMKDNPRSRSAKFRVLQRGLEKSPSGGAGP
ncbi:MAG TPA: 16S rRNA (cytosine(1402)-N(4))-methyltransferase RsmH [Nitrospiria bacterium]